VGVFAQNGKNKVILRFSSRNCNKKTLEKIKKLVLELKWKFNDNQQEKILNKSKIISNLY